MANPKYAGAYRQAGVTTVIDVTGLFLDRLVLEIERPEIHEIASFGAGAGTIIGVTVPEKSHIVGRTVRDVMSDKRYPKDCLVVGIFPTETERLIIPNGSEIISAGDQLVLCALTAAAKDIPQYFEARKGISSLFGSRTRQSVPPLPSQTQVEIDSALEEGENESQDLNNA
jgi:Trk K+ transport system NAD-binding subunit